MATTNNRSKTTLRKYSVTILLLVIVTIFAVQNAATVELQLLFWKVAMSRSLLIFLMLLNGFIIGWFARSILQNSRNRK